MMAVIAPRGEQNAARFVTYGRPDGFGLIGQRVIKATSEALPRTRAWRDEIGATELAETPALFLEGMAGVITPDDRNSVGWSVLREREVFE
jgi:hypothetical protein